MGKYISTATTTTLPNSNALLLQVNAAMTGTVTVSTANGGTIATLTNPTAGSQFKWAGLITQGAISIVTSATCDLYASLLNDLR